MPAVEPEVEVAPRSSEGHRDVVPVLCFETEGIQIPGDEIVRPSGAQTSDDVVVADLYEVRDVGAGSGVALAEDGASWVIEAVGIIVSEPGFDSPIAGDVEIGGVGRLGV